MTSLLAVATRTGAHHYTQPVVKQHVQAWLNGSGPAHERLLQAYDRTLVRERSSVEPIEFVFRERRLEESNGAYKRHAVDLALQVTQAALDQAGLSPTDVDYFISTSCTGFMIPSFDAVVAERLGMKPALRRLPITEHGCAAGAVALSQAHDYLQVHAGHRVLVVSVELPSLTFQPGDRSPSNVISSALFGDGAAAVVLTDTEQLGAPRVVRTASHRFPNSLDWMGFELRDSGLHIVLSPKVPAMVRRAAAPMIEAFLAEDGLSLSDVDHFLLHPGGRKIVEVFEQTLGLAPDALDVSRAVLAEHGNLSSATVLFILEEALRRKLGRPGERGLLMAFGPGFGAEMLLLEWC